MGRIGEEIAKMRAIKGLTQRQLAKQAGVAESYIADVESGKRVMNDQLATRISKLLGGHFSVETPDAPEAAEKSTSRANTRNLGQLGSASSQLAQSRVVYSSGVEESIKTCADKPADGQKAWSEAFAQQLKEVPIFESTMKNRIGSRTMAVVNGKVEGQPKEKVFMLEISDNEMIGYRMQREDIVLCSEVSAHTEDGYYLIEFNQLRVIRHLKGMPGGMLQLTHHKGAPIREVVPTGMAKVLGKLLRVEIRLP